MSAVPAEIQPKREFIMLSPERHGFYQHQNMRHVVTAEENTTIEQVLRPEYFGNIATKLRLYDEIVVRTDEGSFWAELLVLQVGPTWARTKLLRKEELTGDSSPAANDIMNPYVVAWKGPVRKWAMYEKNSGRIVKEGMETRAEADGYMGSYIRTTTGG